MMELVVVIGLEAHSNILLAIPARIARRSADCVHLRRRGHRCSINLHLVALACCGPAVKLLVAPLAARATVALELVLEGLLLALRLVLGLGVELAVAIPLGLALSVLALALRLRALELAFTASTCMASGFPDAKPPGENVMFPLMRFKRAAQSRG